MAPLRRSFAVVSEIYSYNVPKRTTFFQDVVVVVHRHLAPEAEIEESAMLIDRHTGFAALVMPGAKLVLIA
jgi:hypothetical protein